MYFTLSFVCSNDNNLRVYLSKLPELLLKTHKVVLPVQQYFTGAQFSVVFSENRDL